MYYEDHYHPNSFEEEDCGLDDELQDMQEVASSVSSINTIIKKQRKTWDKPKNIDKDHQIIHKIVDGKRIEIECYATQNRQGAMIRNAIIGTRYNEYLVGNIKEQLFFKVRYLATKEPFTLFYDSPEQYERHMKTTVSVEVKENWTKMKDILNATLPTE